MNNFHALSGEELKERYGSFYQVRTEPLDKNEVPISLRSLIPYAEIWGVSDDTERDNLVENAPKIAKEDLIMLIDAYNPEFDKWLAGPEADAPSFSRAYLAFSNMRIAYDYLSVL